MIVIFLNLYIITVRGLPLWLLAQGAKTPSYATVVTIIGIMSVFLTESFSRCSSDRRHGVGLLNTSWRKRWIWSALPSACSCTSHSMAPWQPLSRAWISDLCYQIYRLAVTHSTPKLYFWNDMRSLASATWSADAGFPFQVTLAQLVIQIFQVLHCHENCLLHAQPLHISIITWPFQPPQYHWLTALYVPRLPAIHRRPFQVFRERGHDEFARNFRTRWNNGLMASPTLSPYFWTKRIVDRLYHNCVRPQQFSFRRYPTPPLSLPETSFFFFLPFYP